MIGISKEKLIQIANETHDSDDTNMAVLSLLDMLIKECKELDPWMTLEEFLESGFEGVCFYTTIKEPDEVWCCSFGANNFINPYQPNYPMHKSDIHRVAPIRKPGPPV